MPFIKLTGGNDQPAAATLPSVQNDTTARPPATSSGRGFVKIGTAKNVDPSVLEKIAPPKVEQPKQRLSLYDFRRSPQTQSLLRSRNAAKFDEAMKLLDDADVIRGKKIPQGKNAVQSLGQGVTPPPDAEPKAKELEGRASNLINEIFPDGGYGRRWINDKEAADMGLLPKYEEYKPVFTDPRVGAPSRGGKAKSRINTSTKTGRWYELDPKTAEWLVAKDQRESTERAVQAEEQKRLEGSILPGSLQSIYTGMRQGANAVAGVGLRVAEGYGAVEPFTADNAVRRGQAMEAAAEKLQPGWFDRALRGTGNSGYQMGLNLLSGPAGMITMFAATTANEKYTSAIDAGRTPEEAQSEAKTAAMIEGGITAGFQLAGLGGLESVFQKGVAKSAVAPALKAAIGRASKGTAEVFESIGKALGPTGRRLAKGQIDEQLEELTVNTAQEFASRAQGYAPQDLPELWIDTIIGTAVNMGIMQGAGEVNRRVAGTSDNPDLIDPERARLWAATQPKLAEEIARAFKDGKPITRQMMNRAGLPRGDQAQRQAFGAAVSRSLANLAKGDKMIADRRDAELESLFLKSGQQSAAPQPPQTADVEQAWKAAGERDMAYGVREGEYTPPQPGAPVSPQAADLAQAWQGVQPYAYGVAPEGTSPFEVQRQGQQQLAEAWAGASQGQMPAAPPEQQAEIVGESLRQKTVGTPIDTEDMQTGDLVLMKDGTFGRVEQLARRGGAVLLTTENRRMQVNRTQLAGARQFKVGRPQLVDMNDPASEDLLRPSGGSLGTLTRAEPNTYLRSPVEGFENMSPLQPQAQPTTQVPGADTVSGWQGQQPFAQPAAQPQQQSNPVAGWEGVTDPVIVTGAELELAQQIRDNQDAAKLEEILSKASSGVVRLKSGGTVKFGGGLGKEKTKAAMVLPEDESGPRRVLLKIGGKDGSVEIPLSDIAKVEASTGKDKKTWEARSETQAAVSQPDQAAAAAPQQEASPVTPPKKVAFGKREGVVERRDLGFKDGTGLGVNEAENAAIGRGVGGADAKRARRIQAALEKFIPGVQVEITPDGAGFEVTLPRNGRRVRFVRVEQITPEPGKKAYGGFTLISDTMLADGSSDVGRFGDGLVAISEHFADDLRYARKDAFERVVEGKRDRLETTVLHEMLHAALAFGLIDKNSKEWQELVRAYGRTKNFDGSPVTAAQIEEDVVTSIEDWYANSGLFDRVVQFFVAIADALKVGGFLPKSVAITQARIVGGEVFSRPSNTAQSKSQWAASLMSTVQFSVADAAEAGADPAELEQAAEAWRTLKTQSPWFKAWFGNSVVADEYGNPREMYHGSSSNFVEIDPTKGEFGFHVGTLEQAEERAYAKSTTSYDFVSQRVTRPGANVMPLYVRLENPVRLQDRGNWNGGDILRELIDKGVITMDEAVATSPPVVAEDMAAYRKGKIIELLKSKGYDGVVYLNRYENTIDGPDTIIDAYKLSDEKFAEKYPAAADSYIVFDPEQVKSSIGNRGTFDPNSPSMVFSVERDQSPVWVDNILEGLKSWQPKGTPAQLLAHLQKTRGTNDEAKWIGLDDFLADKKSVTKEEVAEFVEANRVQLNEIVRGGPDDEAIDDTSYSEYQLPGGSAYREMLLTLPSQVESQRSDALRAYYAAKLRGAGQEEVDRLRAQYEQLEQRKFDEPKYRSGHFPGVPNILAHIRFNERQIENPNKDHVVTVYEPGKRNARSGWSSRRFPNLAAAEAFAAVKRQGGYETKIEAAFDAQEKVLFVEEVQSDWHQEGRKKGYRGNMPKYTYSEPAESDLYAYRPYHTGEEWYAVNGLKQVLDPRRYTSREAAIKAIEEYMNGNERGVPDAPFKQSWPMLAMKRMIRWAAEHGFDKLAWTTGEQQAERYDLSKQVKRAEWNSRDNVLLVYDHSNEQINTNEKVTRDQLENYVGKEVSEKLQRSADESDSYWGEVSGLDLKVGGEGMKGFYDRILPTEMQKFVKKFGGTVGSTQLSTGQTLNRLRATQRRNGDYVVEGMSEEMGGGWEPVAYYDSDIARSEEDAVRKFREEQKQRQAPVHSIDITPEMRESVLQGMLMFSAEDQQLGLPSINSKQAAVGVDMTLGRWRKASAASVRMQAEFLDQLQKNEASATLSQYTPQEVSEGVASGKMDVFQLGEHAIYFGLKKGRPWYADMIPNIGDNEVEVVSVINNEPEAKGMAAPAVLTRAIELGATVLDCFSVVSDRFQGGFLPTLYGEFGFEEIGRIPFNPAYYNDQKLAQLESLWEKGGWKRGTPRPDVVVMRWRGNDGQRFDCTSRYLREGTAGVRGRANPDADGGDVRQAYGGGGATPSTGPGAVGGDRGNQGAHGSSLGSRAHRVVQGLVALDDAQLRSLGLNKRTQSRVAKAIEDRLRPAAAASVSTSFIDRKENLTYEEAQAEGVIDPEKRSPSNKNKKVVYAHEAARLLEKKYAELGHPKTPVGSETFASIMRMAKFIFDEARNAIEHSKAKTALGWYDAKVKRAMQLIGLIEPAVGVEPEDTLMFTLALAITSDGEEVDANFQVALKAYRQWKASRGPDGKGGLMKIIGHRAGVETNLKLITQLYDQHGWKALYDFMSTKRTVRELEILGFKVSGERVGSQLYGSMVLGPKIGSFWNNLNGNFDTITMDLWWTRMFGRARGLLSIPRWDLVEGTYNDSFAPSMTVEEARRVSGIINIPIDHARFHSDLKYAAEIAMAMAAKNESSYTGTNYGPVTKKLVQQLTEPAKYGEPRTDADDSVTMLTDKSMKQIYEDMIDDLSDPTSRLSKAKATPQQILRAVIEAQETRLAASTQNFKDAKSMDGNMDGAYETPAGAHDRHVQRMTARLAMQMFDAWNRSRNPGSPKIEPADFQALLWFWEKRLWAKMGVRAKGDIESAYDTAAGKLVRAELLEKDPAKAALINEKGVVLKPRELFAGKSKGGVLGKKKTAGTRNASAAVKEDRATQKLLKELAKHKAVLPPWVMEDAEKLKQVMESIRNPEPARSAMDISISAATKGQPGLKLLTEAASAGDADAHALLHEIARSYINATLGKMASVNVPKKINATGQYFGDVEPSLAVRVTFDEKDRTEVLARLKAFADIHAQSGVYVRQETSDPAGTVYEDGSYSTPVYKLDISGGMSVPEVRALVDEVNGQFDDGSGELALPGVTVTDSGIEAYFVGEVADEYKVDLWKRAVESLRTALGSRAGKFKEGFARLWPYGDANSEIGWQEATGRGISAQEQAAVAAVVAKNAVKISEFITKKYNRPGPVLGVSETADGPDAKRAAVALGRSEGGFLYSSEDADELFVRTSQSKANRLVRWLFTSRGQLPQSAYALKEHMHGYIASHEKRMEFVMRDLKKAVKQVYGEVPQLNSRDWQIISNVLRGGDANMLPLPMRDPVVRMRRHVDELSRAIIESGAASEELAATIDQNLGVYLTRTYRVFSDKNWKYKVSDEVKTRFIRFLERQYPNASENQLQQMMGELLNKDAGAPAKALSGKLGAKLLDVLKQKKNLPEELRELWGEETNPLINYAASVSKMTKLVAGHQFLTEARQAGLGKWLFEKDDPNIDPEASTPIAAEGSHPMAPLNGLRTYPEILEAFENEYKMPPIAYGWRWYFTLNSVAKAAKTVGSSVTQIRNFWSNVGMVAANGNWQVGNLRKAMKAARPQLEAILGKSGAADADMWREFHTRLTELGVVGEEVGIGELKQLLSDAALEGESKWLNNAMVRTGKAVAEGAAELYQWSDNFWKAYAWLNERAKYQKAYPDASPEWLDRTAANIVRDTMPTYGRIPKGIQYLRRIPLGNFFAWPAEIVRTVLKAWQLAFNELQNPETRAIGAQRMVGLFGAIAAPSATKMALQLLLGFTDEDDEDRREFVPPWSKNSLIAWFLDGTYLDMSYLDPYSYIRKPFLALLYGEDVVDGAVQAATELAAPFFSEQLLGERIVDVTARQGVTKDGRQVYNPQDEFSDKAAAVLLHVLEPTVPAVLTGLRNIWLGATGKTGDQGKVYDPMIELTSMVSGARISKIDIEQSLGFQIGDYDKAIEMANSIVGRTAVNRGTVTSDELSDAYRRTDNARRRNFAVMHDKVHAALRQGVPEERVRQLMKDRKMSEADIEAVISGEYKPYMPGASSLELIASRPDGARRVADLQTLWVANSPNPQDAQGELADAEMKRLKNAYATLRSASNPEAARKRLGFKRGESPEARAARLSDHAKRVVEAQQEVQRLTPKYEGVFGGKP